MHAGSPRQRSGVDPVLSWRREPPECDFGMSREGVKMASGIEIRTMESAQEQPFPGLSGVVASGTVRTRSVIANESALFAWVHEIEPGASLVFESPAYDHLLYVWNGNANVDGAHVGQDQVVVVEHKAKVVIEGRDAGATVVHFHQSETQPLLTTRTGGNVHVVASDGLFNRWDEQRKAKHTVWADAGCPTSELWLHRSKFHAARGQGEPHMHNEDEIIFVVEGGIVVGKVHGPGTAIAVTKGTVYTFGVAEGGGAFINFRATNPMVKMMDRGKPIGDWVSERAYMKNEVEVPVIDPRAAIRAT